MANYTNLIDPTCALAGFINPVQMACLQCNPGYYMVEKTCMDSCPTGYVLHSGTQSCQSNFIYLPLCPNQRTLVFRVSLWRLFRKHID